jgi:hypothetical protein
LFGLCNRTAKQVFIRQIAYKEEMHFKSAVVWGTDNDEITSDGSDSNSEEYQ